MHNHTFSGLTFFSLIFPVLRLSLVTWKLSVVHIFTWLVISLLKFQTKLLWCHPGFAFVGILKGFILKLKCWNKLQEDCAIPFGLLRLKRMSVLCPGPMDCRGPLHTSSLWCLLHAFRVAILMIWAQDEQHLYLLNINQCLFTFYFGPARAMDLIYAVSPCYIDRMPMQTPTVSHTYACMRINSNPYIHREGRRHMHYTHTLRATLNGMDTSF